MGQYSIGADILDYIVNSIRCELKLFSMGLKALELQYAANWNDVDIPALYFNLLEKYAIKYAIQRQLTDQDIALLTKAEANAYLLWLGGRAMADQFEGRNTAPKYVKNIWAKTGVDTSGNRRPEKMPKIHLADIFRADNALPIPDWLFDTPHYSPPTMHVAAPDRAASTAPAKGGKGPRRLTGVGDAPHHQPWAPD